MHNSNSKKIIVIGLPGLSMNTINIWSNAFSTLNELKNDGSYGTLQSVYPLISPTIWASLITGTYPNKHGIIEYCIFDNGKKRNLTARDLRVPPLWKLLNIHSLKAGIVNIPFTYPPDVINGFILSGYVGSHEKIASYPPNLVDLLDKKFHVKELYKNITWYKPRNELEFINSIINVTEKESEILTYLIRNFDWDFLITSFFFIEEVFHYLWFYIYKQNLKYKNIIFIKNKIFDLFKIIDDSIKIIVNNIDENTGMLIISPYEIQPLHGTIFLNHLLYGAGLLVFKNSIRTMLKRLIYEKIPVPDKLLRIIYDLFPRIRLNISDIDWHRSIAYSTGWIGQIYINKELIKNYINYNKLIDYIALLIMKNVNDGNIIERILKKEDIAPNLNYGPDLYLLPKDFKYVSYGCGAAGGESFADFGPKVQKVIMYPPFNYQSAWHRMTGFIIAYGSFFKPKYELNRIVNIVDIAPTILHMFNIPIPEYIDGDIITEFFK